MNAFYAVLQLKNGLSCGHIKSFQKIPVKKSFRQSVLISSREDLTFHLYSLIRGFIKMKTIPFYRYFVGFDLENFHMLK